MPDSRQYSSAYAIFEGGGAKALAHVGALRALEDVKLALVGVAGTSAGAIVAALVAVGYKPEEIFASSSDNILNRLNLKSPVDLLGRATWESMKGLKRRLFKICALFALGLLILLFKGFLLRLTIWLFGPEMGIWTPLLVNISALFAMISGVVMLIASCWPMIRYRGLFQSKTIRDVVNKALREKLLEYKSEGLIDRVEETVLFEHIDPIRIARCIPLKIVATNITDGELTLFDRRTPHIPVADAVAASAALPFAFQPARVNGYTRTVDADFADGGLVSNLPSWVFRDEKKARERLETRNGGRDRIPIYAFSLVSDGDPSTHRDRGGIRQSFTYFMRVLTTGIFGGQAIIEEFVPDLKLVPLRTKLSTMAFDCTGEDAEDAVTTGQQMALEFLKRERFAEDLTNRILESIFEQMTAAIGKLRGESPPRIRIALIDPICRSSDTDIVGFRVVAGAKMENDADDTLEIDLEGDIAAAAYRSNKAVFGEIGQRSPAELFMTKYERALLPTGLQSVIAIPIYARPDEPNRPKRVLAMDSCDDLSGEFKSKPFMDSLIAASASASHKVIQDAVDAALAKEAEGKIDA